jgi:Transglycosylase-like domain
VKVLLLMLVLAWTLLLAELAFGHARWKHPPGSLEAPTVHEIQYFRGSTWEVQDAMGEARTPTVYAERRSESEAFRLWIRELWRGRLERAQERYEEWKVSSASGVGYGVWAALASCESGGDWSYNGGSGFDGGLQFHPSTWAAYASSVLGVGAPAAAYLASPGEQIAVAEAVLEAQGWGAWPACSAQLGLR